MPFLLLALRNLFKHPVRTFLTSASLAVAFFLMCMLQSIVTSLQATAQGVKSDRLWVQSAVSLFVDLPLSYPAKIQAVDGVKQACKWQWFGGYYQEQSNFFAQFAIDSEAMLDMYNEVEIVDGARDAYLQNRIGCMIGRGLADRFGWKIGDRVPITGALFPHPDGSDVAWEFDVEAIYEPTTRNFDNQTLFFHWKYFEETQELSPDWSAGVGAIVIEMEAGANEQAVMREVDGLFENGPQRVQTTTESEFQAQFVSMFGNVPFFVGSIGGAVFLAILLACVNTMLMAAREQTRDVGILKALGFGSGTLAGLMFSQSLAMSVLGGGLGLVFAKASEGVFAAATAVSIPNFFIADATFAWGGVLIVVVGSVAGFVPALQAGRVPCVDALNAN